MKYLFFGKLKSYMLGYIFNDILNSVLNEYAEVIIIELILLSLIFDALIYYG